MFIEIRSIKTKCDEQENKTKKPRTMYGHLVANSQSQVVTCTSVVRRTLTTEVHQMFV